MTSGRSGTELSNCTRAPPEYLSKWISERTQLRRPSRRNAALTHKAVHLRRTNASVRLCVGCSNIKVAGWMLTDRPELDLLQLVDWAAFALTGIDAILAEHVLEHFTPLQARQIAAFAYLFLMPGGTIRIAVPDAYHPSDVYQQYVRVGSTASGTGQNHMVTWSQHTLPAILEDAGFATRLHEHYTASGKFRSSGSEGYDTEPVRGSVRRSSRHEGPGPYPGRPTRLRNYASLWFDAIKPPGCGVFALGPDRLATSRALGM